MKSVVFVCLLALGLAAPQYKSKSASRKASARDDSAEVISILKDERTYPEDGRYSVDVETGNNIVFQESGARIDGGDAEGAVAKAGVISFILPDGQIFELKYVADENGFQPQSDFLPVAPENPHPIPDFVLAQIEKAEREREEEARAESVSSNKKYSRRN